MRITLPENISDITLLQFQKYNKLIGRDDLDEYNFNKRKIEIFTELNRGQIDNIKTTDYKEIIEQIDKALNQDVKFKDRFKLKGIEFGFIPNLDEITGGEYVDLREYGTEVDTLHNLMAILFRPIKDSDVFNNYTLYSYNGTKEYAELMKEVPLSIVNGALVFFSSLANELVNYTQKYMKAEQVKER
jgi:hypothetical protein